MKPIFLVLVPNPRFAHSPPSQNFCMLSDADVIASVFDGKAIEQRCSAVTTGGTLKRLWLDLGHAEIRKLSFHEMVQPLTADAQ